MIGHEPLLLLFFIPLFGIFFGPLVYFIIRKIQARKLNIKGIPSWWTFAFWLAFVICDGSPFLMPKIQCKSKISEAKINLACILTTQNSYFEEYGTYSDNFAQMYWEPESQNMYTYYCGNDIYANARGYSYSYRPDGDWSFTIKPASSKHGFTCFAIGNIDNDDFPDIWMMTDQKKLVRVLDDEFDDDTVGFLIVPQNWKHHLLIRIEKGLPYFLLLAPPILLILSIIRDETRWRRARRLVSRRV